jgi:hypothetical protein
MPQAKVQRPIMQVGYSEDHEYINVENGEAPLE